MRILNVTPYYAPEGGGLERYAHAVASRLVARGHDVCAVALSRGATRVERKDGVRLARVEATVRVSNTPLSFALPWVLRERLRVGRVDVVIGHSPVPFAAEMAALEAERAGVPFIHAYHAGGLMGGNAFTRIAASLVRRTLEARALASARAIVTVSPLVRSGYLAAHREKTIVVPPGVDGRFLDTRDVPGPDAPTFIFIGPLDAAYTWKGFAVLFEAFRLVLARVPDARCVVIGDGDRRASWEARAERAQVRHAFSFRGKVSDETLVRELQEATALVLPSTTDAEALGMVTLEANACCVPVIASRVGGVPAFIDPGVNGCLVPPGDATALADAMIGFAENRAASRLMGERGRARVIAAHDWERAVDEWEALLARVRHDASRSVATGSASTFTAT